MTLGQQTSLGEVKIKGRSQWGELWRRLRRNRPAVMGLFIAALLYVTALFAPWDEVGRDLLSRIIWGTRSAAFVSITVTLVNLALGVPLGTLAGYFHGWVDTLIMRLADILFAFPGLLFIFFIAATVKPSILTWVKAG